MWVKLGVLRSRLILAVICLSLFACGRGSKGNSAPAGAEAGVRAVAKLSDSARDPIEVKPVEASGLPIGTIVPVSVYEVLDSDTTPPGTFGYSVVDDDVKGTDGKIAIPRGSPAIILVRTSGREGQVSVLALSLYQVTIAGKSIVPLPGTFELGHADFQEDASKDAHVKSVHFTRQSRIEFKLTQAIRLK